MSLNDWQKNGWLRPHTPSAAETQRLLDVVDRDLRAAGNKGMDDDWRFVAAYNAALQSANIMTDTNAPLNTNRSRRRHPHRRHAQTIGLLPRTGGAPMLVPVAAAPVGRLPSGNGIRH